MPTLSIVIPAYNSSETIIRTLKSIICASKYINQIIIIDDCSNDSTFSIIEKYKNKNNLNNIIDVTHLNKNSGPSIVRKVGYSKVTSDYVIFFDSDDVMKSNVIDETIDRMEKYDIPVSLFKYEINREGKISGMWPEDEKRFKKLITNGCVLNSGATKEALLMTNYPWNKICKTNYLQSINLQFGNFRLHEDVLLHWQILLNAQKILLVDKTICEYFLPLSGNNATHDHSDRRLLCIDVLEWLRSYIWSNAFSKEIQSIYLEFTCILTGWAYNQIDSCYKGEFRRRLKKLLIKIPFSLIFYNFNNKFIFNYIRHIFIK